MLNRIGRRAVLALPAKLLPWLLWQPPADAAPAPVTLSRFLTLSTRLTGRRGLDSKIAAIYLNALAADPDRRRRLASLTGGGRDIELEGEIITSWYTGVYKAGGEDRLATHRGALLWKAMGVPVPGNCGGATGFWSRPPEETR
jgi:hypothetical protein